MVMMTNNGIDYDDYGNGYGNGYKMFTKWSLDVVNVIFWDMVYSTDCKCTWLSLDMV